MESSDQPSVRRWSVRKATLGGFIGIVPGFICWLCAWGPTNGSILFPVLIGIAGAFVGLMLTRPDVSARRVAKGTAVMMAAKALPRPMRQPLYDELFRKEDSPPSPPNACRAFQPATAAQPQGESPAHDAARGKGER